MTALFKLFAYAPLWLLHALGAAMGWLAFLASGTYRRRFLENTAQAGLQWRQWLPAVAEAGKLVAELPRIWLGKPVKANWVGGHWIDDAHRSGKPIVFLTPHLGSFEVAGRSYAARWGVAGHPLTVLFRPARQPWLREVIVASRERPGLLTAPTTLAGVKQMMKALKAGDSVALLPDQVPPEGQGVWASFFGRDAYTMTLSVRLAQQSDAVVLLVWARRLSWGRGYRVQVEPLDEKIAVDLNAAAIQVNRAMESLVLQAPGQYLWGYARYKQPKA